MDLVQRLEANSIWEPNSGCRLWEGALIKDHGVLKVAGVLQQVHRVAWELERGPIPAGLWVLHTCGVGSCFNVNHLRLGDYRENARDRQRHGGYRGAPGGGLLGRGMENYSPRIARGPRAQPSASVAMTQTELRRILRYDQESGEFHWLPNAAKDHSWNMKHAGEVAGSVLPIGYVYINFNKKLHLAHRLAWLYMTGEWPTGQIDHINRNRTDNRWANLRLATQAQNSANQGLRTNNRSGIKGVSWDKKHGRWTAMITAHRKQIFLGYFSDLADAVAARRAAEECYHGTFANTGTA